MAVQVVQKKTKVTDISKVDVTEVVLPEVVDEFAALAVKVAKKKAKIAPLEKSLTAKEKAILASVDEVFDEATSVVLNGEEFDVSIGPKGQRTELADAKLAAEMLGEALFMKLAKISVTDLKKYLTPEQVDQVTTSSYAIKRRTKVEPTA